MKNVCAIDFASGLLPSAYERYNLKRCDGWAMTQRARLVLMR
jgi:hypothetical protein